MRNERGRGAARASGGQSMRAGQVRVELEQGRPLTRFYLCTDEGDGAHMSEISSAYDRSYSIDMSYTWCEIQTDAGPEMIAVCIQNELGSASIGRTDECNDVRALVARNRRPHPVEARLAFLRSVFQLRISSSDLSDRMAAIAVHALRCEHSIGDSHRHCLHAWAGSHADRARDIAGKAADAAVETTRSELGAAASDVEARTGGPAGAL